MIVLIKKLKCLSYSIIFLAALIGFTPQIYAADSNCAETKIGSYTGKSAAYSSCAIQNEDDGSIGFIAIVNEGMQHYCDPYPNNFAPQITIQDEIVSNYSFANTSCGTWNTTTQTCSLIPNSIISPVVTNTHYCSLESTPKKEIIIHANWNGTTFDQAAAITRDKLVVEGNDVEIADFDSEPSSVDNTDFGSVAVNATKTNTFTIINSSTSTITIDSVATTADNSGQAQLPLTDRLIAFFSPISTVWAINGIDFSADFNAPMTLQAGDRTTFTVQFQPSSLGLKTARVVVSYTDTTNNIFGGNHNYLVQGTGIAPAATATNNTNVFTQDEDAASFTISSSSLMADDAGDGISMTSVEAITGGTVSLSSDKATITFTPDSNFNGLAKFKYTITDSLGRSSSAEASGTINAINDKPVVKDSPPNPAGSTTEDIALAILAANLLANFTDIDSGDALNLESATNPINGSVTLVNGVITFTPSANFVGEASFDYTVKDSKGATATATFKVNVTPANDPPVLKPSAPNTGGSTEEDKAFTLPAATLLANFSDADTEDELTLEGVANPVHGSVTLVDGVITFTPEANFVGEASFDYTVKDSKGATATATFKVNVTPANDPPVLKPSAPNTGGSTEEDKALSLPIATLLANFSDADTEDELTLEGVANPVHGSVTLVDGVITFTPEANFVGEASFDYTIKDSKGATATATFKVNVTPANDPPVLKPSAPNTGGSTEEDKALSLPIATLLANFSDADTEDELTLEGVANPVHGSVTLVDGVITFTPEANFVGEASFDYTIKDSKGATATATFKVNVTPANDPPVLKPSAPNTGGSTEEDKALSLPVATLLANFSDADTEDELTLESVTNPKNGTVAFANGIITFTPSADFVGEASFDYTIKDSKGATATATFKVTVTPANDPPIIKPSAPNTSGSTEEDKAFTLPAATLLANFSDADTEDELTLEGVTNPKNGTVAFANGIITFTPSADFVGEASFDYTIKDSKGATATATFKVTVTEVADQLLIKGNGSSISNGASSTTTTNLSSFGDVQVTKTLAHTFTIENPNTLEVQLVSVSFKDTTTQSSNLVPTLYQLGGIQNLEAAGAGDFFLINTNLPLTIAKQSSAAFDISFAPSAVGLREADVSLSFSNGSTFSFRVSGSGVAIVEPPNNIPIFNPIGLLLLLIGLLWLGRKRFS